MRTLGFRQLIKSRKLNVAIAILIGIHFAHARDDGRYAASPLKAWFDQLASGKGLCCSMADGFRIENADWQSKDGHYQVRLAPRVEDGKFVGEAIWIDVPDDAVITQPNRAGVTMVWPVYLGVDNWNGDKPTIRCFMPGSMT